MLLVVSNKGKGMQSSSEQPFNGEDHCVTTLITAAKATREATTQSGGYKSLWKPFVQNLSDGMTSRKRGLAA